MTELVHALDCPIQRYAWGSHTAIAALCGRDPSPTPEAELWMGAHPRAPARVVRGAERVSLIDVLASDPEGALGPALVARHGARLPFLAKVLAADAPLSIQVHPDAAAARAGFLAEEARGVARDAPERIYKDPYPKPELLLALGPFEALRGFRPLPETLAEVRRLAVAELAPIVSDLAAGDLAAAFAGVLRLGPGPRRAAIARVAATASKRWLADLAARHPDDAGVLAALFLNRVRLVAGQAIDIPPGTPHAYLRGVGIEIMMSSDNVVRGGLTPKHVDVAELLAVLRFETGPVRILAGEALDGFEHAWDGAGGLRLSRVEPGTWRAVDGPEIVLSLSGGTCIQPAGGEPVELGPGGVAFVTASAGAYAISGRGPLFRARMTG